MIRNPDNPDKLARHAGLLYLLIAVTGAFAIAWVPSRIVVTGDAVATLANLQARPGLFRLGMAADIVVILSEIALSAILFFLLRPVGALGSLIAALARYAMVLVMLVNLMLNITAFTMAQGDMPGGPAMILALFDIHAMGIYLWGVLFAVHLLVLGTLVWWSGFLPRLLGAALVIGAFGYLIEGVSRIIGLEHALLSALVVGLLTLVTLAELSLALWLTIRGVDVAKWRAAVG